MVYSSDEIAPTDPAHDSSQSLWSAIKESIRGSHRDYTTGPIGRAILLLSIPMVLEMVMESIFAVVDVYWVSRLGTDAAATVGLTESILTLIYALAIGLSIGPRGVFSAITIAFSTLAVVSAIVFRQGRWKRKVV